MRRAVALLTILILSLATAGAKEQQPERAFTVDDLLKIRRVADPQISPDGRWVVFTIADTDKPANRRITQVYLVSIDGGQPRALTSEKESSHSPRWSADGKRLAFISARGGESQIWTMEFANGETSSIKKVSSISSGADSPIWSPDGKWIAFTSEIYPGCPNDDCNKKEAEKKASSKVKAKVADHLLFRHWNVWKEDKRSHIFVVPAEGGEARDLTPGNFDAPPFNLGGQIDYSFSPDSKELAYARNTDKDEARSTNGDIFVVPVLGGDSRRITGDNPANDLTPVYSPDGRYLGYRAQARAGFEADRWRLILYDRKTGQSHSLTEQFDMSVESFTFSPDSQRVYLAAPDQGHQSIYEISIDGGPGKKLINDGFNDDVQVSADGKTLVFTRQSLSRP